MSSNTVAVAKVDFPGWTPEVGFELPNTVVTGDLLDEIMRHCKNHGASDVTVQSDEPVRASIKGRNLRITKRALTVSEVEAAVNYIYGSNGVTRIRSSEDIDTRHSVVKRGANGQGAMVVVDRVNFRVNITGCWSMGNEDAVQITARVIQPIPPSIADLGLEAELVEHMYPSNGLVLVCGGTGSGKSTALAAVMRGAIEDPNSNHKIITIEHPIEYVYDDVKRVSAVVSQHEVGRHIPSFARGVRGALRRKPTIILVGETRDLETGQASLEASQTGHAVYTTLHTNNVATTVSRYANLFPTQERMTKVFEIVEALRLVLVQRLLPRPDGKGMVALREWLPFDQTVRDQLRTATTLREVEHMLSRMVERRGRPMVAAAQQAFDANLLSSSQMALIERESRSSLIEDLGIDM